MLVAFSDSFGVQTCAASTELLREAIVVACIEPLLPEKYCNLALRDRRKQILMRLKYNQVEYLKIVFIVLI